MRWALIAAIAVLLAANPAGNLLTPSWSYVPQNLALTVLLWWIAVRIGGASAHDLGLDPATFGRGLRVGGIAAAATILVIAAAAAVPAARPLFEDERAADAALGAVLFQALIRIPLGTALYEEFAFRGVLYGLSRRLMGVRGAVALTAVLFGFWHVLPAFSAASSNDAAGNVAEWAVVVGIIAFTAVAGLVFIWVRERADSLLAPILFHAAINSTAFVAAWLVMRGG
jgi:membrane protease YdiL (CAAX protease family)